MVLMDLMEGNVGVDIESGGVCLEPGSSISTTGECDTIWTKASGRFSNIEGLRGEGSEESSGSIPKSGDVHVVVDRNPGIKSCDHMALENKGYPKEKHLKPFSIKHSKPPRPPKGPLLNASDILLVREISELAVKKRQKIEKTRALKKMKAARGSSCGGSVIAMVITVVFFIIIILQGVCSGGGIKVGLQGSPEPSVANKGLISMEFYSKSPSNEINGPIDCYPRSEEPASGSLPQLEEGRDAQ